MRVLHIITGLNDGGAEAVLYRLVTHDADNDHHVVSLTGEGKYGLLLQEKGIKVTALEMPRGRVTASGFLQLWRTVRAVRPDVVQTWMYHADLVGGIAARAAGTPVVWGIRNTTLEPGRSSRATIWVARVCAWLSRWVPNRIVVCAQAAQAVHTALGYDAARMVVIPNGYDLSRFAPDFRLRQGLRAQWGVSDDLALLGMVARWDPQKDHINLIDALALLRRCGHVCRAVLVGTGVDEHNATLMRRIADVGLSDWVQPLGPRTDVPAVMNALDVHVLSSAYGEAFPNVLAEAMACGTPCVTTDVGDAAQIVGDTGWVVPPRNSQALAEALAQALTAQDDRAAWATRQQRCRERIAENYSIEAMVQRYRQVWREVGMAPAGHKA